MKTAVLALATGSRSPLTRSSTSSSDGQTPGAIWPGWDGIPAVRSRRVPGFPFRLVYLVQPAELILIAFAHDKRLPGYWRERLSE